MTRRVVRVELGGNTATLSGPRLQAALELIGARWMWHPTKTHRTGAIQVPLVDLDDVLAALQMDGQLVEVVDQDGKPLAHGGLLGGRDQPRRGTGPPHRAARAGGGGSPAPGGGRAAGDRGGPPVPGQPARRRLGGRGPAGGIRRRVADAVRPVPLEAQAERLEHSLEHPAGALVFTPLHGDTS